MTTTQFLALLISGFAFLPAFAQTKPARRQQSQKVTIEHKDDDIVSISTNLVQVDAVVIKDGKVVPNLTADDFEIFEDGKEQTITSFAFILNVRNTITATDRSRQKSGNVVPFTPFKPQEPHRTIAFVVDDLGLSAQSMHQVKLQLRKFVTEQLQPNDLIAIIRTGGELGVLQQFTTDTRLLNRAVEQLRWNPCSRVDTSVFTPIGSASSSFCSRYAYGNTLASLRFILEAMGQLPGRKSMVLLSDSIPLKSHDELLPRNGDLKPQEEIERDFSVRPERRNIELPSTPPSTLDSYYADDQILEKLAERAIRASVVIYSVDTQGLAFTGITAADNVRGNAHQVAQAIQDATAFRSGLLVTRREGAELLARRTGGFQIRNSNSFQFDRIMEDQSGYYLLGYRPTEQTFDRRFHHIKANVKRSGMTIRTRYGFLGMTEEEVTQRTLTAQDLTNLALGSPFGPQDIEIDLTSYFADKLADLFVVRSYIYFELKDLTFTPVRERQQASIEIHGVVFGDNGTIAGGVKRTGTLDFSDVEYRQALQSGFGLMLDMPVRRAGSYHVRVAIRDRRSSLMGSAGAFVAVPNLKDKHLAVSGIVLGSVPQSAFPSDAGNPPVTKLGARRFQTNSNLYFAFRIYNSAVGAGSQSANMVMETKLFCEGKNVFSSGEAPIATPVQARLDEMVANGVVPLSASLEPGHYYLQVLITEKGTSNKAVPVIEWIDFDIVK